MIFRRNIRRGQRRTPTDQPNPTTQAHPSTKVRRRVFGSTSTTSTLTSPTCADVIVWVMRRVCVRVRTALSPISGVSHVCTYMVCFPSFILSVLGIVCLGNRVVICRALANERTAAMRYRSPRRSASGPLATLKVFVGGVCLFLDGRRRKKCDRICELEVGIEFKCASNARRLEWSLYVISKSAYTYVKCAVSFEERHPKKQTRRWYTAWSSIDWRIFAQLKRNHNSKEPIRYPGAQARAVRVLL